MRDIYKTTAVTKRDVQTAMSREQYLSSEGLNPSVLKKGLADGQVSPLVVRHHYENPPETTQAQKDRFAPGTLGHMAWLEPERVPADVAVWSGGRRAGNDWKEFVVVNAGKLIVKKDDYDRIMTCTDQVLKALRGSEVLDLLSEGESEVAVFSEEYGLQTRGQLDWINTSGESAIVDLKFSDTHSERVVDQNISRFNYDLSLACYHRWFTRESHKQVDRVVIVTICTTPPYGVVIRELGEVALEHGWDKADRVLAAVRGAIDNDSWDIPIASDHYTPPHWELEEQTLEGFDA